MSEREDLPDTAMATGNDEGEPGDPDTRPLAKDERRLLKELRKSADGSDEPAPEDSPEVAPPPPGGPGDQGDGLTPEFTDR